MAGISYTRSNVSVRVEVEPKTQSRQITTWSGVPAFIGTAVSSLLANWNSRAIALVAEIFQEVVHPGPPPRRFPAGLLQKLRDQGVHRVFHRKPAAHDCSFRFGANLPKN